MEDVFAAVDARPKRRQGVTGQTIEAQMRGTMCQITEYELGTLRDEITRLTRERDQAINALSKAAEARGRAEGKLEASELPGIVDGWKARAERAEAERDTLRAENQRLRAVLENIASTGRCEFASVRAALTQPTGDRP